MNRDWYDCDAEWRMDRNEEICQKWLDLTPVHSLVHQYGLVDSSIRRILRAGISKRQLLLTRVKRWKRGIA